MKTLLARQRQEGFFTVRIKSAAGKLDATQLSALNDLAETFGNGSVNLTSRQEISIPFVRKEDFETIQAFATAHGLRLSPIGTIFKQVTACQGTQSCPAGIIDSPRLAQTLDAVHGGKELPSKITCSVTGCPNNCMKVDANDIGIAGAIEPQFDATSCIYCGACSKICPVGAIEISRSDKLRAIDRDKCIHCGRCVKACRKAALRGEVGYKIYFAGKNLLPLIRDEEKLYKVVEEALKYFAAQAKPRERLRKLLTRRGVENFKASLVR